MPQSPMPCGLRHPRLLKDTFNTYTWETDGNLASANGVAIVYDAFGRMVENQSSPVQYVYDPTGQRLAAMQGQNLVYAAVPFPGGAYAAYNSSGLYMYSHGDWLGSTRLLSTPSRSAQPAMAYAPFGEGYAGGQNWVHFTVAESWTVADGENQSGSLEDFMFRRYSPVQGRWISPDPAGMGAVNMANPQSWNRYAYVTNSPLNLVDALGLQSIVIDDPPTPPPPPVIPSPFDYNDPFVQIQPHCDDSGCQGKKPPPKSKSCIPRKSLSLDVRAELAVLGWMAQRSGGVRAVGVGGAGAFSPASLAGGGGSAQALWMADYLGQQGLYWSVSGGPTVGQPGAGVIGGVQYMTSTLNTNVTVQDVVNSSLSGGGAVGAGFAVGVDVNLQTGVFTETIGFGIGGFGGAPASLNIASGFIFICKE